MAVACSVTFAGLRFKTLTEGDRMARVEGLPDVLANRCLGPQPDRR
jgi:hypothetical protein